MTRPSALALGRVGSRRVSGIVLALGVSAGAALVAPVGARARVGP